VGVGVALGLPDATLGSSSHHGTPEIEFSILVEGHEPCGYLIDSSLNFLLGIRKNSQCAHRFIQVLHPNNIVE